MAKKRRETRNLIVVSDTHAGCRLALYPPDLKILVDDGGHYRPSKFQEGIWQWWREFWDEWVPEVTRGEPFDFVHNGDAIEGDHHRATTQVSHNHADQIKIAKAVLEPIVERVKRMGGEYYHIRGTEAHVGSSAANEELLAESLKAKPNSVGQFARWDMWKRVGGAEGPLVHLLHHIGTTGSTARETSAVNAELAAEFNEAAQWGRVPPDVIIRSHRHRYSSIKLPTRRGGAVAACTPGWQGKTPFTWKIAGARLTEPQFGGLLVRYNDEGVRYVMEFVRSTERSAEE